MSVEMRELYAQRHWMICLYGSQSFGSLRVPQLVLIFEVPMGLHGVHTRQLPSLLAMNLDEQKTLWMQQGNVLNQYIWEPWLQD